MIVKSLPVSSPRVRSGLGCVTTKRMSPQWFLEGREGLGARNSSTDRRRCRCALPHASLAISGRSRTRVPRHPLHTWSKVRFYDGRRYFLQLSLTMLTLVTLRWPCSVASLSTPCSFISSLTSSLAPCMSAFRTLPVTVTVWPA